MTVGTPVGSEVAIGNAAKGIAVDLDAKLALEAGIGMAVTLDDSESGRVKVSS